MLEGIVFQSVEFYQDASGCPVRDFLDRLDDVRRAKLLAAIKLLEEHGPTLPFPYSSQIEGRLRELRTRSADERLRVMYFGDARRVFVLVHAFLKHTEKTPSRDIEVAGSRMNAHVERLRKRRGRKK
jgi:phage-related protein